MSVDKVYDTLEFPFELSEYGAHGGMKAHLAELIESVDGRHYSQSLARLFIHSREDLTHKVSMLMVNFINLESVKGFEGTAKSLQTLVRDVWVLDRNLRAKSALGTRDDFQQNIRKLYENLDLFVFLYLTKQERKVIRTIPLTNEDALLK
jgi:hypothetical protein